METDIEGFVLFFVATIVTLKRGRRIEIGGNVMRVFDIGKREAAKEPDDAQDGNILSNSVAHH